MWRSIKYAVASLLMPEGRRAWALMLMGGGCAVMTLYAAWAMYMVQANVRYVLFLGLAAHVEILVCLTGFAGLLVKRNISAKGPGGVEFHAEDRDDPTVALVQAGAAVGKAGAAVAQAATDKLAEGSQI